MKRDSDKEENTIGINIRKLREKTGLTQKELADKLYVSDNVVSKWERGESRPDPETLVMIAEIFGVEIGSIIYSDEDARTQKPSEKVRRRLPQNPVTLLCIGIVVCAAAILMILSIRAYIVLPDSIGVHFGPDGEIDLYGDKGMLFMCPAISILLAIACLLLNFVKMKWKINILMPVYIDDLCEEEGNRRKIYKVLSVGINLTLLTAQSMFFLLGCCMGFQKAVPAAAMWSIVVAVIVVPLVSLVVGSLMVGQIKINEEKR